MADRNKRSYKERFQDQFKFNIPDSFLLQSFDLKTEESKGFDLFLEQDSESASCIWDASIVLSSFMVETAGTSEFREKRCLEIGSGCGLSGLVMGFLCKEMILTDLGEVMPVLHRNVESNVEKWKEFLNLYGKGDEEKEGAKKSAEWNVKSIELFWGNDCSHLNPPFDVIIGADVVYEIQAFDLLITSLVELSSPETLLLFSFKHRWADLEKYSF
eukprot:TRINITY_DN14355_c0_g1_i1.p1 TRINITY_DN14355_c0_g1~~TRINITY_DN14355_c0_g1_i1.p1  ORF type:complete len:215 (-),score=60.45 TRINITY_DN14355_c0_g1_i1:25-669(-)